MKDSAAIFRVSLAGDMTNSELQTRIFSGSFFPLICCLFVCLPVCIDCDAPPPAPSAGNLVPDCQINSHRFVSFRIDESPPFIPRAVCLRRRLGGGSRR